MLGAERLLAYQRQAGAQAWSQTYQMTAKQERRYVKKWWRDATPWEQDRYKRAVEKWEAELLTNGRARKLKTGR